MAFLHSLSPLALTVAATLLTWGLTALGAAAVFFRHPVKADTMTKMLGLGAGIMIAACFWSLLSPAMALEAASRQPWLVPCLALLLGGGFVLGVDRLLDGAHSQGSALLVVTAALHNVPEGLVIGVAFGSGAVGLGGAGLWAGLVLALGIGLQNFPEGAGVALPLHREGRSQARSFFWGQLSGMAEPVAAVLGVLAALRMPTLAPFLLAFSAGAMIAVAVGDLIPPSAAKSRSITITGFLLGFVLVMMVAH